MIIRPVNRFWHFYLALSLSLILSACGGGGSSPDGSSSLPSNGGGNSGNPPAQTFSASLSWNIPDTRENGASLEVFELGGYELQYKLSGNAIYTRILINDGTTQSYEISGLSAGTYEFRIASFDSENVYSDFTPSIAANIGS